MARDPSKIPGKKKQSDRNSPVSRIIDLEATEMTALPKQGEPPVALADHSADPARSDAAAAEPTVSPATEENIPAHAPDTPFSEQPIPVLTAEETPDESAPPAGADMRMGASETSPVAEPATGEAAGAPEAPRVPEPHGIDPAVFERAGGSSILPALFGTLAGIAACLLVLWLLSASNLLPSGLSSDAQQRLAGVEASIRSIVEQGGGRPADTAALQQRLDSTAANAEATAQQLQNLQDQITQLQQRLAASLPGPDAPAPALASDVDALRGQLGDARAALDSVPKAISDQVDGVRTQLAEVDGRLGGLREQLSALDKRQEELTTGFSGLLAATSTATANQERIDTLATEVGQLAERQKQPTEDIVARRLAVLDFAGERLRMGLPFPAEAGAIAELSGGADTAAIRAVAENGVPMPATLAARARAALAGVARPAEPGTPFLGQLAQSARSLVTITPVSEDASAAPGRVPGDLRATFVDRLQGGDLIGALSTFDALDTAAKNAVTEIVGEARARLAAEQALAAQRNDALAAAAKRS